jgi:K+-transporting ATPase ATPase A chain
MSWQNFVQALALVALLALTVPPLGRYIAAVYGSRDDGTAPGDRSSVPSSAASTGSCRSTTS